MRYKFRYLLAFILLWVSSAFTCGQISLEPLVRDLLVRVQALEERSAEDVVVIDSNGTAVGKLVDGLNLQYLPIPLPQLDPWEPPSVAAGTSFPGPVTGAVPQLSQGNRQKQCLLRYARLPRDRCVHQRTMWPTPPIVSN